MVKSLFNLPQNVKQQILVRLPLKTLFASRCVCRNFFDLTSLNDQFIELHSSNAPQSLALQFLEAFGPSLCIKMFEPEIEESEFRLIFELPSEVIFWDGTLGENRFVLVNSCNGLLYFCVKHTKEVYSSMCNPVTNEVVRISFEDSSHSVPPTSQWLGFDSSTNHYKILRIFGDESRGMESYVADLQSRSVRDVEYTPLGSDHSWDASSIFVNGVIHWFDSSQENIVFFDFEKEMFGEIALPLEERQGNKDYMSIGVLEGCLALSYNVFSEHNVNIWVLESRNNQQCWRKKLVVDTTTLRRMRPEQFKPLQILRNGELLMLLSNNDLVYYDPNNTSFRFVELCSGMHREVVVYTPSFISLKDAAGIDPVFEQDVRPSISLKDPLRIDKGMVQNVRPSDGLGEGEEWALCIVKRA